MTIFSYVETRYLMLIWQIHSVSWQQVISEEKSLIHLREDCVFKNMVYLAILIGLRNSGFTVFLQKIAQLNLWQLHSMGQVSFLHWFHLMSQFTKIHNACKKFSKFLVTVKSKLKTGLCLGAGIGGAFRWSVHLLICYWIMTSHKLHYLCNPYKGEVVLCWLEDGIDVLDCKMK